MCDKTLNMPIACIVYVKWNLWHKVLAVIIDVSNFAGGTDLMFVTINLILVWPQQGDTSILRRYMSVICSKKRNYLKKNMACMF